MRRDVFLDNIQGSKEGLIGNMKAGGSLGCSNHKIVEFRILCERNRTISWIAILDFKRANFDLF